MSNKMLLIKVGKIKSICELHSEHRSYVVKGCSIMTHKVMLVVANAFVARELILYISVVIVS
jgi:hypothetical protein